MNKTLYTLISGLLASHAASAATFESGNWSAAHVGHACHVFTQHAAKHTSGAIVFTFYDQGYNAEARYDYAPWPGETGAPWTETDYPLLAFDEDVDWLGDEMFADQGPGGYSMHLTGGFVSEFIAAIHATHQSIDVMIERSGANETVVYGRFSPAGFAEALTQASMWCRFDPNNLPIS